MQARHPKTIAVVSLDINCFDKNYQAYSAKPAEENIESIKNCIQSICETFKRQHHEGPIVIGWREYGLTSEADEKAISKQALKKLKRAMADLVEDNPNLVICAGAMAIYKHKHHHVIKEVLEEYATNIALNQVRQAELAEVRAARRSPTFLQVERHELEAKKLESELLTDGFYTIQNSAILLSKNEKQRHDKTAPWAETSVTKRSPVVFQPPRKPDSLVNIKIDDMSFAIQLVICQEHLINKKIDNKVESDLYMIMSDSIDPVFDKEKMHTRYAVQFDSVHSPKLVDIAAKKMEQDESAFEMVLYTVNLLDKEYKLAGPFQAISLFAYNMISAIDEMISDYSEYIKTQRQLMAIREQFEALAQSHSDADLCLLYQEIIKNQTENLYIFWSDVNCCCLFKMSLPDGDPKLKESMALRLGTLNFMIMQEQREHVFANEDDSDSIVETCMRKRRV